MAREYQTGQTPVREIESKIIYKAIKTPERTKKKTIPQVLSTSTRFCNTLLHAHSEITFDYTLELEIGETLY